MKTFIKKAALAFGILAIGFTACKKENLSSIPSTQENVSDIDIEALITQTDLENQTIIVNFDENELIISASNNGISFDYLVNASDLDETPSGSSSSSSRKDIRDNSFVRCLRMVKPDSTQIEDLRTALALFDQCKSSAFDRALGIHLALKAKYQKLAKEQAALLADGKITRQEFDDRMQRLRVAFAKELKDLQIRAKLHQAFRDCHKTLLKEIKGILNDRQWKAFIDCYKK